MNGSMLPSSARSLRPREAGSPSAHSLTPERCEAKTPGENTCPLVAFSITISMVLVPVPSAGSSYCAWAIDEMVKHFGHCLTPHRGRWRTLDAQLEQLRRDGCTQAYK